MAGTGKRSPKPKPAKTKGGKQVSTLGPAAGWGIAIAGAGILGAVLWKKKRTRAKLIKGDNTRAYEEPQFEKSKEPSPERETAKPRIRLVNTIVIEKGDIPLIVFRSSYREGSFRSMKGNDFIDYVSKSDPESAYTAPLHRFLNNNLTRDVAILTVPETDDVIDTYISKFPNDKKHYVLVSGGEAENQFMSANDDDAFNEVVQKINSKEKRITLVA